MEPVAEPEDKPEKPPTGNWTTVGTLPEFAPPDAAPEAPDAEAPPAPAASPGFAASPEAPPGAVPAEAPPAAPGCPEAEAPPGVDAPCLPASACTSNVSCAAPASPNNAVKCPRTAEPKEWTAIAAEPPPCVSLPICPAVRLASAWGAMDEVD